MSPISRCITKSKVCHQLQGVSPFPRCVTNLKVCHQIKSVSPLQRNEILTCSSSSSICLSRASYINLLVSGKMAILNKHVFNLPLYMRTFQTIWLCYRMGFVKSYVRCPLKLSRLYVISEFEKHSICFYMYFNLFTYCVSSLLVSISS